MYAFLHLITKRTDEMSEQEIYNIMKRYYQGNINHHRKRPQFDWDHYTIDAPIMFEKPEDCFVIIDPHGYAIARRWWNGSEWVDQNDKFEEFVRNNREKWKGCAMYEIHYHY